MHRSISDNFTTHTRYLFNGMEADNEVSGTGNSYTTEFRQYDPRLGYWKSLDPLMAKFPWQSPYCAMNNNPISLVDPTGQAAEEGDNEDWIKKEGSSQWEFDSEVQSPEKAKELYGANTQYKDVGDNFKGQKNGASVGDVNLGENGKMTWGNGHQATVADNAQTRLPIDGGYSTPNSHSNGSDILNEIGKINDAFGIAYSVNEGQVGTTVLASNISNKVDDVMEGVKIINQIPAIGILGTASDIIDIGLEIKDGNNGMASIKTGLAIAKNTIRFSTPIGFMVITLIDIGIGIYDLNK